MRGERVYTMKQASRELGVRYLKLRYAMDNYSPRRFERYEVRLVTLRECEWAMSQVGTGRRAS